MVWASCVKGTNKAKGAEMRVVCGMLRSPVVLIVALFMFVVVSYSIVAITDRAGIGRVNKIAWRKYIPDLMRLCSLWAVCEGNQGLECCFDMCWIPPSDTHLCSVDFNAMVSPRAQARQ